MKPIRNTMVMLVCVGFLPGLVQAEFRPWTDSKGNSVEAEYVRMTDDTVVLRKRDGSELKVPLDSLSEEDCQYAMLRNPPKIEIKVDDDMDSETVGYLGGPRSDSSVRIASVSADVTLRKKSTGRYDAELTVEVLLIGKTAQLDRYTVLERSDSAFCFTEQNKGLYTFACGPADIRNVRGNRNTGVEYEGFLVVVRDSLDAVVAVKGSRIEFEKNVEALLKAGKGALFDKDFKLVRAGRKPTPQRSPGAANQ